MNLDRGARSKLIWGHLTNISDLAKEIRVADLETDDYEEMIEKADGIEEEARELRLGLERRWSDARST